jgi:hypothetical protein
MTSIAISDLLSGTDFSQSLYQVSPRILTACAGKLEARSKGKQSNIARLLDRQAETPLVPSANSGQTARNDLATLGNKALK